jgi:hypothetical protein
MKVVFVGPSLPDAAQVAGNEVEIRPPACQGNVMQAVYDGATSIGLIDGHFEFVAPVWHKELLFALAEGISVFGAASMGALRAAECAPFGMSGIGRIYEDYAVGRRNDDADVALLHGPAELNYPQVTVPIVNMDATLMSAEIKGLLRKTELEKLSKAGRSIFFKERTWKKIAVTANLAWPSVATMVRGGWIDQKRLDAIALMKAVQIIQPVDGPQCEWIFNATPTWRAMYP